MKNRKAECQEYQIVSIYGKVQVHTENEKTETVNIDSFLEEIVLKCYSNETRWRISEGKCVLFFFNKCKNVCSVIVKV